MNLDPREQELRRATFTWMSARFQADAAAVAAADEGNAGRRAEAPGVLQLVDTLRVTRDFGAFRVALGKMVAVSGSHLALQGPNGQMVMNQVDNLAPDTAEAAAVMSAALSMPEDESQARHKIGATLAYFDEIRTGNQLQAGRVAPLLSAFWSLAEPGTWPAMWASAATAFEQLGWTLPAELGDRYTAFRRQILELGEPEHVLSVLHWYHNSPWPGVDPTIRERVVWGWEMKTAGLDTSDTAMTNAEVLHANVRRIGDDLADKVGTALDRAVTKRLAPKTRTEGGKTRARYDDWVSWPTGTSTDGWTTAPAMRLWFGLDGVLVGLHPGYREKGWIDHAKGALAPLVGDGLEVLDYYRVEASARSRSTQHDFFVGRFHAYGDVDWDGLGDEVVSVATRAASLVQHVLADAPSWSGGVDGVGEADLVGEEELRSLFREFVAETGYPSEQDQAQIAAREGFASLLEAGALDALDVPAFRQMLGSPRYGYAGNRAMLNTTLADPDEEAVQVMVTEVVRDLLYGDGSFEERLDRCPPRLKGLGQAGAMKLLAIVYPDRFLPIYPLTGPAGKIALLGTLGIGQVPEGSSGSRAVEANDIIKARLSSVAELVDDPWGQMCFAYWLRDRAAAEGHEDAVLTLEDRLAAAAEVCTLAPDSSYLQDLYDLLRDKGQIVLYGPPGTGKTYLALELAKAIAPDEECRELVQFHPSMAYEDFMEGYRPVLRQGSLTYELAHGPLIELADRARSDRRTHVLVIDEMNRANLPKVFGELLFLLEYRGHPMKLAYRAKDDEFTLPKNLWVIGTMNLADRSVGQIDAALRRRFAFVPFSPNDEENGGLLRRWLEKRHQPVWPADLVDWVNSDLEADLGHSDLLIGPSYFLKEGLDEATMARIWRYAIEPLMSDLFHGDEQRVKKYSWTGVLAAYGSQLPGRSSPREEDGVSEVTDRLSTED